MRLRTKVALLLVAIVLPTVTAFTLYRVGMEKRFVMERIADRAATRMQQRPPRRCDFAPERRRRGLRGVQVFAYDTGFAPILEGAPEFPAALQAVDLSEPIHLHLWRGGAAGATAFATENEACPNILIVWKDKGLPPPAVRSVLIQTGILLFLLLLTALGISAPIVRRLQRLSEAVQRAPDSGFQVQVETEAADEIGELARAFNASGEKVVQTITDLEARDAALKGYIANTTHDLAIPLTVLQHRLRKAAAASQDPEVAAHLKTALEESHYMSALVKNLNVSAKLEASEIYFQPHQADLVDLLERVITRHQPIADGKQVQLNYAAPTDPVDVVCDSTLIEQAISNLVQNAVQYTSEGGHVAVVLDRVGEGFELRIEDDGPGIDEAVLDRVFERSVRADDARTRNPEGLGLGLSISLNVFRLHDWDITLSSNEGLTVCVKGPTGRQDS